MNQDNVKSPNPETIWIAKITAGLSHDFMNTLATIRERAGLIEDLMDLHKEAAFPFRDKLSETLKTIREQVLKGIAIGEKLNRFAHSMDQPMMRVDANDLMDLTTFLMQHFTRRRKIQLNMVPSEPPLSLETNPLCLLLLIAACIEYCMDRTGDAKEITLQCQHSNHGAVIQCRATSGVGETEDTRALEIMQSLWGDVLNRLQARLETLKSAHEIGLVLTLPSQ